MSGVPALHSDLVLESAKCNSTSRSCLNQASYRSKFSLSSRRCLRIDEQWVRSELFMRTTQHQGDPLCWFLRSEINGDRRVGARNSLEMFSAVGRADEGGKREKKQGGSRKKWKGGLLSVGRKLRWSRGRRVLRVRVVRSAVPAL